MTQSNTKKTQSFTKKKEEPWVETLHFVQCDKTNLSAPKCP